MKKFQDIDAFRAWLSLNDIDSSSWGTGNTKSLINLWHELNEGEIILFEHPPLRVVNVVQVIIRQGDYVLLEAEQVFGDGQRRYRDQPPAEKMKPGETYIEAAMRCLVEELGVEVNQVQLFPGTHRQVKTYAQSSSYPGLPALYNLHIVEAAVSGLPETEFWRDNRSFTAGDPIKRHKWVWRRDNVLASPPD